MDSLDGFLPTDSPDDDRQAITRRQFGGIPKAAEDARDSRGAL
jgi:hypothetical protein